MDSASRPQTRLVTIVFWVLLSYIIVALAWWFLSLERQNREIYDLKVWASAPLVQEPEQGSAVSKALKAQYERNTRKYIYEGVTFFILILFGAAYIYRLVRRQFRLQQQQQNFVMAITHELKTPLSVARLNLETVQKRQLPEEKQQRLLSATLQETLRLDTLINNVLLSSQLDAHAYTPTREELDFSGLVRDVVSAFRERNPARDLQASIGEGIEVDGDPLLLQLLLSNLLENANKYSPREGSIQCVLEDTPKGPLLQVRDEGPGIVDEEKKRVFEKFYRVGSEQTRRSKGTGLGLYICSRIARAHGATLALTDNAPQGATFTARFKKS
ncbi:MAG: HAMP domain-containing histidine kinase [Chitinophagaceae bacterium]|nr:MAG: HAMP domain-containing histidine kinase [Chitinophagaceae bacterium]